MLLHGHNALNADCLNHAHEYAAHDDSAFAAQYALPNSDAWVMICSETMLLFDLGDSRECL